MAKPTSKEHNFAEPDDMSQALDARSSGAGPSAAKAHVRALVHKKYSGIKQVDEGKSP